MVKNGKFALAQALKSCVQLQGESPSKHKVTVATPIEDNTKLLIIPSSQPINGKWMGQRRNNLVFCGRDLWGMAPWCGKRSEAGPGPGKSCLRQSSRMSILLQRGNDPILASWGNRIPNRPRAYTDPIQFQITVSHWWSSKHILCTQTILTWESLSVVWPGGHRDNMWLSLLQHPNNKMIPRVSFLLLLVSHCLTTTFTDLGLRPKYFWALP